jgi:small subunit ribosomal protein S20
LANTPQAKKRARQAEKHRQHNAGRRASMRTTLKKALKALDQDGKTEAATAYQTATSAVDRAARKGLIHPNKAARHKSRLGRRLNALSA